MSTAPAKKPAVLPKAAIDLSQPTPRRRVRMTGWWVGGVVGLVVLVSSGYTVSRWAARDTHVEDPKIYTVKRISFPVVLKERGELKAKNNVEIRCELPGQSRIVSVVEEGTEVKKGSLLLELDSDQLEEEIRQEEIHQANATANYEAAIKEHEILLDQNQSDIAAAELRVRQAERDYEKYIKGDYVKALKDAELDIERAVQVLSRKNSDLEDAQELHKRGYITQTDLENDRFEAYEAQVALDKARLAKHILETYTHPNDFEKRESEIQQAHDELERKQKSALAKAEKSSAELAAKQAELDLRTDRVERLHEQAKKTTIHAPTDGFVVYGSSSRRWWDNQRIETGAQVYQGQILLELPDPSVMQVSCRIHESKTEQIHYGQSAVVEVEGITGVQFTGQVTKISALADSRSRWLNPDLKEYTTDITLDQNHPNLKPGGTATCYIAVTHLDDVLAVPVQTVFARGPKRFVFVKNGSEVEPAEVELGMAGTEYVVVESGLEIGQEVLLSIDEDLLNKLPSTTQAGVENASYFVEQEQTDERRATASRPSKPAKAPKAPTEESDEEPGGASPADDLQPAEQPAETKKPTTQAGSTAADTPTTAPAS